MPKKRFSPEQVVALLRQIGVTLPYDLVHRESLFWLALVLYRPAHGQSPRHVRPRFLPNTSLSIAYSEPIPPALFGRRFTSSKALRADPESI